MKTTIDLPDALFIEAKKLAAEERKPLRSLFIDGLRMRLKGQRRNTGRRIKWVTSPGGVPAEAKTRAGMYEWLEKNS